MQCPKCRQEMEEGYAFGIMSLGGSGLRWSSTVKTNYLGGEELAFRADKWYSSVFNMPAYRCVSCRLVLFEYDAQRPFPASAPS